VDAGEVVLGVGAGDQQPLQREGVHHPEQDAADVGEVGGGIELAGGLPARCDLRVVVA
jgi:hypothetical protein